MPPLTVSAPHAHVAASHRWVDSTIEPHPLHRAAFRRTFRLATARVCRGREQGAPRFGRPSLERLLAVRYGVVKSMIGYDIVDTNACFDAGVNVRPGLVGVMT